MNSAVRAPAGTPGAPAKRKYNTWSATETTQFLQALAQFQRDFARISSSIGTKDYSQTRDYFYRLLKGVRASVGPPWDKEIVASNIHEVTVLIQAFADLKAKATAPRIIKDTMITVLTNYRSKNPPKHRVNPVPQQKPIDVPPMTQNMPPPQTSHTPPSFSSTYYGQPPDVAPYHGYTFKQDSPDVLENSNESSPQDYNFPKREKYTIKLFPANLIVEKELCNNQINPYLALSVGRSKKISSVATYLEKKWRNALPSDRRVILLPRGIFISDADYIWGGYTPSPVHVGTIVRSLGFGDTDLLELEYDFVPLEIYNGFVPDRPTSQDDDIIAGLEALESLHKKYDIPTEHSQHLAPPTMNLEEDEDEEAFSVFRMDRSHKRRNLSFDDRYRGLSLAPSPLPSFSSVLEEYDTNHLPTTGSVDYSSIPELDIMQHDVSHSFGFDDSRDGFEGRDERKYEQKCRAHWYEQERSLDYSSYYESPSGSSPCGQKRRI